MKFEELHICDWVYQWDADGKHLKQVTKETFALSDEDLANFEGVPLTREYLLAAGFHANEMAGAKYDYLEDCGISLSRHFWNESDDEWSICVSSDEGYESASVCSIYYVHELQHFLEGIKDTRQIKLN